MDVEQFVKDVLGQLSKAISSTNGDYELEPTKGIFFSLAVSTTNANDQKSDVSGGLRVKVLSGEASKAKGQSSINEVSSRIEFTIQPD